MNLSWSLGVLKCNGICLLSSLLLLISRIIQARFHLNIRLLLYVLTGLRSRWRDSCPAGAWYVMETLILTLWLDFLLVSLPIALLNISANCSCSSCCCTFSIQIHYVLCITVVNSSCNWHSPTLRVPSNKSFSPLYAYYIVHNWIW